MIKSQLGRFLTERKADLSVSASESEEGGPRVINYEAHLFDATNEDGVKDSIQVESYKTPTNKMLPFPDYKREKSFSYDEYMLDTPANFPKNPNLQALTHHYLDKNREETFMDRSDIYTEDNHLVASYPVPEVKPQKILDLIPQEQRDKYPVEVEEITYEEYLELSKKGETFEEPLDEDDDEDEFFHLYNDNVGFDSQKNSVRIKFEDLLETKTDRPRASRRNDFEHHGGFYEVAGGGGYNLQPMKLVSPSLQLQIPSVIHQPIVLPSPQLEGQKKSRPSLTGIPPKHRLEDSNLRRMDLGIEEYVYVDENSDNNIDSPDYDEDAGDQNSDNDDSGEDVETKQPKPELMEKNDFVKPSPVYVVYPNSESDISSTSTTAAATTTTTITTSAETVTQQSTKLFDIEYDQFL